MSGLRSPFRTTRITAPLPDTLGQGRTAGAVGSSGKFLPSSEVLAEYRKSFAIVAATFPSDCDRGFFNSPTVTYFSTSSEMANRSTVASPSSVAGR